MNDALRNGFPAGAGRPLSTSLALSLRGSARAFLPARAFLRRDRGDSLFVSDAPRLDPGQDWIARAGDAGFVGTSADGLLRLIPGAGWLSRLEAEYPEPPDFLCASMCRFAALEAERDALALFALGARVLDGEPDTGTFERRLRQRTAVCLRRGGGGGLYACALLTHIIKEENQYETEMARTLLF